ncbi:hypothetical protein CBS101457_003426 [Exobasidium rhododendri]|nr:hypothetical protein CBS101457_003426 [Exobasidium rhododendri]
MSDSAAEKRQAHPLDLQDDIKQSQRPTTLRQVRTACAFALLVTGAVWLLLHPVRALHARSATLLENDICPQVEPFTLDPQSVPATPSPSVLAHLLSGAVRVNTSVYDDYPLPVSSFPQVWEDTFAPFRSYLKKAFPAVHASDKIVKETVNEHGLLYTWVGTNSSLKPIIFMAHQDVVPVDPTTISSWTHAPFLGYVDEKEGLVYGRGAGDDKASLVSLLTSFESLLPFGFEPQRSIILSFGFDEEASGTQGGEALANHLESVYGRHQDGKGAFMIVDEGEGLDNAAYGFPVAGPAVSEKGYLDVKITVNGKGGHSSDPPRHTTIGILSKIISRIEDNPWKSTMGLEEDDGKEDSPGLKTLLCLRDAPKIKGTRLGRSLERLVKARKDFARKKNCSCRWHRTVASFRTSRSQKHLQKARQDFLKAVEIDGGLGAFVTTQAVDLIGGGVKVNALPEEASAVVNHRINVEESVQDVRDHLVRLIEPLAGELNCKLAEWGSNVRVTAGRRKGCMIVLEDAYESALEPAPRTPTEGSDAAPYRLLSSTIRGTWKLDNGHHVRVVPSLMQGNTDTKSYHALTRHIFRFSPNSLLKMKGPADGGIHTVDEKVQIDSLTKGFEFYTALMTAVQA